MSEIQPITIHFPSARHIGLGSRKVRLIIDVSEDGKGLMTLTARDKRWTKRELKCYSVEDRIAAIENSQMFLTFADVEAVKTMIKMLEKLAVSMIAAQVISENHD
ncbi:MAG: hypothetical protein E6Q97_13655 [Desulfurellales bacterium]|nr:MAG: hypothetical protein E6Q97_13655 [Desulfurellales bacterium]